MQNPWAIEPGQGLGDWRLGASREDVLRRLAERGIPSDPEPDDGDLLLIVDDLELELKFDRSQRLSEIIAESERLILSGHAVIGARAHEVVDRLRATESETLWTREDQVDGKDSDSSASKPPSDEELITDGTLWIPRLGLGLELWRGEILCVRIRKPADVPLRGLGSLTPSQRTLLAKPDLADSLDEVSAPKRPPNRLQQILTLAMIASMGWLVWTAIDYQQKWSAAPTAEGEVIAVQPPPPDPFPDALTVAYQVDGKEYQTVFGLADVYLTRAVGDKVDVRYLAGAPEEPMGPARVNDAAFLKFVPWGIGIFGTYLVLQLAISLGGSILRATAGRDEFKTELGKQYD